MALNGFLHFLDRFVSPHILCLHRHAVKIHNLAIGLPGFLVVLVREFFITLKNRLTVFLLFLHFGRLVVIEGFVKRRRQSHRSIVVVHVIGSLTLTLSLPTLLLDLLRLLPSFPLFRLPGLLWLFLLLRTLLQIYIRHH